MKLDALNLFKKSLKKNRRYFAYIIYGNNKNSISNMFIVNDEKENVSFILDEKYTYHNLVIKQTN